MTATGRAQKASNLIGAVIVSCAITDELAIMTQTAIDTCGLKDIIVIEQTKTKFKGCKTIRVDEAINYNKFLNIGARHLKNKYICFSNNDIIFEPTWAEKILEAMIEHDLPSACPYDPSGYQNRVIKQDIQFGYEITKEFVGWAFVWHRNLYEWIGLDERFPFYCADDVTVQHLIKHNIAHACIRASRVKHLQSQTLKLSKERQRLTVDSVKAYNRAYKKNVLNLGV